MKIWLSCFLLFFCISCALPIQTAGGPLPSAPDSSAKNADAACSYFYFLWGKTSEIADHPEEALAAYEKALVCDGEAEHVMQSLAVLLARMGRKAAASAWLEKLEALRPLDVETLTFLANLNAALENSPKAIELYHRILQQEPENFHAMLLLGTLYARDRNFEAARKVLATLVDKNGDSYIGHLYLGKLQMEMHQLTEAIESYRKALQLSWSESLAFETADLYERLGQHREAAALYQEVLKGDEMNEEARARLISLHLAIGELDQALTELKALRSYASDSQKVDFGIGRILLEQGNYEEAAAQFSRMLEEDPHLEAARYLLALVRYEAGEPELAMRLLGQIAPDSEAYDEAVLLRVKILDEEGRQAEAEQVLLQQLQSEGEQKPVFYMALAALFRDGDKAGRGLEIFAEALKKHPDDPRLLFQYGIFLEHQGRSEEALEQMQKVLILEPRNPYALNYVGYTWADRNENLEQALDYIQQAVSLKPRDGYIRDSLGWVYFRLGEIDKAIAELEEARDLEPEDPNIWEHLGDVYLQAQRPEEAAEAYRLSIELYEQEEKRLEVQRKLETLEQ